MTQNRINNSSKKQQVEALVSEENRIDWERKQKSKRQGLLDIVEEALIEEDVLIDTLKAPKKKQTQKKGRHFVYDEDRDTVVVQRKRRRHTDRLRIDADVWYEWDDES
jgi:hypothetical protein